MTRQYSQKGMMIALLALTLTACVSRGVVSERTINNGADKQWAQIMETVPESSDPVKRWRVAQVTERILTAAGEDPADWEAVVFDSDETMNAFALPNNRIGIFTGLIEHVENDDQLAAIVGHEVAHVRLHHAEARINRNVGPAILIGVAKLPGAVTGVGAVKSVGNAAGGVVAAGTVLPFGRGQELEADLEGLKYLYDAGYDPTQAAEFWRAMNGTEAAAKRMTPEFFSTHPSDERRIAALEEAATELVKEGAP